MRKLTWLLILILIIVLIAVFSPLVTGIYFAKEYPKILHFYNENGTVTLTLKEYHRGWFSSDAVLEATILPSPWTKTLLETVPFPQTFTAYQHIQHGPILYHNVGFNTIFGLASIENNWQVSENLKTYLKQKGLTRWPNIKENEMMTLTGRYITYFDIDSIDVSHLDAHAVIQDLSGRVAIDSDKKRLQGNVNLQSATVTTPDGKATISDINLSYDQRNTLQNLWIGNDSLKIASIQAQDKEGTITLNNIDFNGQSDEEKGLLDGFREFSIAQLTENIKGKVQSIGPLNLKLSIHKINAQAVNDLLTAYRETSERGELYALQLQQKLMSIAPALINADSSLVLDGLTLQTPDGDLQLTAKIYWPTKTGDQLFELIQSSSSEANLRISKKLIEHLIQLAAEPAFMKKPRDPENLTEVPASPSVPSIGELMSYPEAPANTPSSPSVLPDKIHAQITEWLNAGYILQDADNYTVKIERKNGQITINGKPI